MPKSTSKKVFKIVGIIIIALLLIAVAALLYINHNASKIGDKLFKEAYAKSELKKVYDIEYEGLKINVLSGNFSLINFKITPNPGIYTASDSLRLANPLLIEASIPELTIEGLDIGPNFNFDDLKLTSILFNKPTIKLIEHLTKEEMKASKKMYPEIAKDTSKKKTSIDQLKVESFTLNKGDVAYYSHLEKKTIFEVGVVNIAFKNATIRPGHIMQTIFEKSFEESTFQVKDIYYPLGNGFYDIKCREIDLKLEEKSISLFDVEVIPKYNKEEFGKKFGKQTDRFDITINEVEVVNIEIKKLLLENKIEIANIIVSGADANLYRDKNITFDTTKYPPLPNQLLGQIEQYINIGKLEIKKSRLVYEEFVPGAEVVGKVPITNLYGTIYNITNSPEVIAKNGPMKWDAQGKLFDEAVLSLVVDFPKDLNEFSFKFHGGLEEISMHSFNSYTKSNLKVDIIEGTINSMLFSADAGSDYSTGTMTMAYEGVKIKVLKEYTGEYEKKMGFVSSLANLVIKSNNPPKKSDKPADSAEIFFVPDKHKAIINYMVKSLIGGIVGSLVPAAGMTEEKYHKQQEKEVKKEEHEQKKETRVQEKETKKETRQRKREEKKNKKSNK